MGREIFLLKCKQWRVYKVSVNTVRVLYGVMVARRAAGGDVVTSGQFTDDAKEIDSSRNIDLLEGKALHAMIQSVRSARTSQMGHLQNPTSIAARGTAPICPACNAAMVKRTAKQGSYAYSEFWSCPKYSACLGSSR